MHAETPLIPMSSPTNIHCWDLVSNGTIALVIAIIGMAALGFFGRFFPQIASPRIRLMIVAAVLLSTASLFAWQKQHRRLIEAENLVVLKAFDTEANRLFEESLSVSNAADYTAYSAKADLFAEKLERWVAESMGPKASEILQRHDPKHVNVNLESTLDKDHASAVVTVIQTRENIAALIEAGASERCVKPTSVEHPIPKNPD
jgi:hypothetical protein